MSLNINLQQVNYRITPDSDSNHLQLIGHACKNHYC